MPATSSTSSSDRRLYRIVLGLGVLGTLAFFSIRSPRATEWITWGASRDGGDLYRMVRIPLFREQMGVDSTTPPILGIESNHAEVLMIGDSHTRFARGGPSLAGRLERGVARFRSVAVTNIHPRFYDPLDLLRLERIQRGVLRFVVMECAERTIPDVVLGKIPQPFHAWDTTRIFEMVQMGRVVKARWFQGSEAGYQYLLMNSVVSRRIVETWNAMRFAVHGSVPASVRVGTGRHLFLAEESAGGIVPSGEFPSSPLQSRSDSMVDAIALQLVAVGEALRREYGAELVFLPVPAKTSLLHENLGIPYDGFLSRLKASLDRHGVANIDSWGALRPLGDSAVFRTETHLADRSYAILADSVLSKLSAYPSLAEGAGTPEIQDGEDAP